MSSSKKNTPFIANAVLKKSVLLFVFPLVLTSCSSTEVQLGKTEDQGHPGLVEDAESSRYRPIVGKKGMVVADDLEAAAWGVEQLKRGGNAVDAAVATAFALSVTRPQWAALGGGGFLLFCPAPKQKRPSDCYALDYREVAPKIASRDMYRDTKQSQDGALASGVPGVVAGLLLAQEKWGKLSRSEVLRDPIRWAKEGVVVSGFTEVTIKDRWKEMNPAAQKIFSCGKSAGATCEAGDRLIQRDLARVLEEVSRRGRDGFYRGWVAKKIAESLKRSGGILTEADLAGYRPRIRIPVRGDVKGWEIVSMAPPSAGGAGVIQMMKWLEMAEKSGDLKKGFGSLEAHHALISAMGLAFADRAVAYGDPEFVTVPLSTMLSEEYLKARWKKYFRSGSKSIPEESGVPAPQVFDVQRNESMETTHFSVVDREGNAVALTTTVNGRLGSGFVPDGTGVVMNNEMDDFSIKPGVPNMFGLVGQEANSIRAGKRPLSSMSPTIVRDSLGRNRIVLGAQGGPRITTSVFQTLANRIFFGMSLPDALLAPRLHFQWKPISVFYEAGFGPDLLGRLGSLGYDLKPTLAVGKAHGIERFESGRVWGASDQRAEGGAVAEY